MTFAPPAPPTAPAAAAVPPARPGARVVAIVMIVIGALVAVGTGVGASLSLAARLSVTTGEVEVAVLGVTHVRIDVDVSDLTVAFADVDQASLEVTGRQGADRWNLDREGGDLVVRSPMLVDGTLPGGGDTATLRLPESLLGIDADVTMDAGDLSLDGVFDTLSLDLGGGSADVRGTAASLDVRLDAGEADFDVSGVDTASFTVDTGDLTADLGGGQPRSVSIVASAADVAVTVAPGEYRLTGDAADGDLVDTDLVSDAGAASTIDAQVSASDVTISAAR